MSQRLTDWIEGVDLPYFKRQFENPYESTKEFTQWLQDTELLDAKKKSTVLDLGAGMGATLSYMSDVMKESCFVGIDINPFLVKKGNEILKGMGRQNAQLQEGDWYNLHHSLKEQFDGIVSLQTLSWLPEFETPVVKMLELNPKWIALTSLFYDGEISAKIEVKDYTKPTAGLKYKEAFYNIYSLSRVREFLAEHGYGKFRSHKFNLKIDLEGPKDGGIGTKTVKTETGERLQFSGPILMNWYFISALKI